MPTHTTSLVKCLSPTCLNIWVKSNTFDNSPVWILMVRWIHHKSHSECVDHSSTSLLHLPPPSRIRWPKKSGHQAETTHPQLMEVGEKWASEPFDLFPSNKNNRDHVTISHVIFGGGKGKLPLRDFHLKSLIHVGKSIPDFFPKWW